VAVSLAQGRGVLVAPLGLPLVMFPSIFYLIFPRIARAFCKRFRPIQKTSPAPKKRPETGRFFAISARQQ